jgi:hypothetical protein
MFRAILVTVGALIFSLQIGQAEDKVEIETDFLLLPAHELNAEIMKSGTEKSDEQKKNEAEGFELQVGDKVKLSASLEGVSSIEAPPGEKDLLEQGWYVQLLNKSPKLSMEILAVPMQGGNLKFPSLALKGVDGKLIGRTLPLSMSVKGALNKDDEKPEEFLPPVSMGFPLWVVLVFGIFVIALIVVAAYLYRRWSKNRKKKPVEKIIEPPRPEDIVALEALRRVEEEALWKSGKFKPHYFSISDILKVYLGTRYGFDAVESTAGEILKELERKSVVSKGVVEEIALLFHKLDLTKFTDQLPGEAEAKSIASEASSLVEKTRRPILTAPSITPISKLDGREGGRRV